jgi:hypothetical protein
MATFEAEDQVSYESEEDREVDSRPLLAVVDKEVEGDVEQGAENPKVPVMPVPEELADLLDTPEKQQAFWKRTAQAHQMAQQVAAQQELEQRQQYEQRVSQTEYAEVARRNTELDEAANQALKALPRTAPPQEREQAVRIAVMAKKREHDMRDMAALFDGMYSKYQSDAQQVNASRSAFFTAPQNQDVAPFRDLIEQWVDSGQLKAHQAADVIRTVVGRLGVKPPTPDIDDTELYAAGFSSRAADALKKQIRAAGFTEQGRFGASIPKETEKKADALVSRIVDDFFGKSTRGKKSSW